MYNKDLIEPGFKYSSANRGQACKFSRGLSLRVAEGGTVSRGGNRAAAAAASGGRVSQREEAALLEAVCASLAERGTGLTAAGTKGIK